MSTDIGSAIDDLRFRAQELEERIRAALCDDNSNQAFHTIANAAQARWVLSELLARWEAYAAKAHA